MKQFDVLGSETEIYSDRLLEASAGTGKTFSIENIVVRLLIEPHPARKRPLAIEEILVVTFTRAATRDLVQRIRGNIRAALEALERGDDKSGYLAAILEKGAEAAQKAIRALEEALFTFDRAEIHTIHGFSSRMLRENVFEGNMSLNRGKGEELSAVEVENVVRNCLRTELSYPAYSKEQIAIALSANKGDYEKLESSLIKYTLQECPFAPYPTFEEEYSAFAALLAEIKERHKIEGAKLYSDYEAKKALYNKNNKITDPDGAVAFFAEIAEKGTLTKGEFGRLLKEGLAFVDAQAPSLIKAKPPKKVKEAPLYYPGLIELLQKSLHPIVERARSKDVITARIAADCKRQLMRYSENEEKVSFDDLLRHMASAVENPAFAASIKKRFAVAIIDEFQDTDPLQWQIFQKLFLARDGDRFLTLVGDPKQAIYSFRQADIYTYLSAAEALGEKNLYSLDTNYRSTKELIAALNYLFASSNSPGLIPLPRLGRELPYRPVKAGKGEEAPDFGDDLAAVNLCLLYGESKKSNLFPLEELESDKLFPFIAGEIEKICSNGHLPYSDIALLVADRFQAERLSLFLQKQKIPYALQRTASLAEAPALAAVRELLSAVIDPKDESAIKCALGGKILQMTHRELLAIEGSDKWVEALEAFYALRRTLFEKGFSSLYEELLESRWFDSGLTALESLLAGEGGIELFDDMQQIAELLMEHQAAVKPSPEALLAYIDEFETMAKNDHPATKRRRDTSLEAVTIITMHSSKGLEYGVVFALAAIKRSSPPGMVVPTIADGKRVLTALLSDEEEPYKEHCREIDAEKMRQLYVGMTRAKYRLYLPVPFVKNSKTKPGSASPVELYAARAGYPKAEEDELYRRINDPDPSKLLKLIKGHPHIRAIEVGKGEVQAPVETGGGSAPLHPPKEPAIPGCDLFMHSFSSLTRSKGKSHTPGDEPAPQGLLNEVKTPHTLPAGSETGNLLHAIFETLDFMSLDIEAHVERYTANSPYEEWSGAIAEIVRNTLAIEIGPFTLREIPSTSTYREMEFTTPIDGDMPTVGEVQYLPGYLTGIIDLLLEHKGLYYIVDWKSNWLGAGKESYTEEAMRKSIADNSYHLQAALYREALKRYLAIFDKRPFEEIFGGAYYIYLRGSSAIKVDGQMD